MILSPELVSVYRERATGLGRSGDGPKPVPGGRGDAVGLFAAASGASAAVWTGRAVHGVRSGVKVTSDDGRPRLHRRFRHRGDAVEIGGDRQYLNLRRLGFGQYRKCQLHG